MKTRLVRLPALALALVLLLGVLPSPGLAEGVVVIGGEAQSGDYVELAPSEQVRIKGEYGIAFGGAKWRSDKNLQSGGSIGYLTTRESGEETTRFDAPVGTHTPMSITFEFTNMSMENTNALGRVECRLVYDEKYEFTTMAAQVNPDQTAANGNTGYASTDAVPVEPLVTVGLRFFAAVPLIVRDTNRPLTAYLTLDDTTYAVELRDVIEIE